MSPFNRQSAASYASSAILHAALIAAVIGSAAIGRREMARQPAVQTTVADRSIVVPDEEFSRQIDAAHETPETSIDRTEPKAPPSVDDPGWAAFARKQLEQAGQDAQDQSSDDQLAELESLGRRLERVASAASVQEVSQTLSQWLGASERASEPASPLGFGGEEFDVATAQISEVHRNETEDGTTYVALLVDAQGNAKEALLDEIDGPRLYETFQLMKRFPLLESVYRGAVIGLLDKLVPNDVGSQDSAAEAPFTETDHHDQ